MLKIAKVLNNNIAVAVNNDNQDVIVMGRGVGFQKQFGDVVDEGKVERVFTQDVPTLTRRFRELAATIPEEYFEATQEIIAQAKLKLGHELSDSLYLALSDHIHFAVERCRKGMRITNRLLIETRMVYPDEFAVAQDAVAYLNKAFDICLPEDEAAFIALHFVNASAGTSMSETVEITRMVKEILDIICTCFSVTLREDSLDYYRLMVHLKFFAQRVAAGTKGTSTLQDRQLLQMVRTNYRESYRCVQRIVSFIRRTYHYSVPESERVYLTVHIERIRVSE